MATLSGNNCTIITIIPMEVECNVTNASSPTSADGVAQVQIFGGTAPYTIQWSNGQQGTTITNLLPGTYSATVTDYYGDYVITTSCVVGSTGIVYQFDGCDGGPTIYVSGSTYDPPFPYSKPTIIFNEISGCYDFVGPISSAGLTYSALTVSNSFSSCVRCYPPTPTPIPQTDLCLFNNGFGLQYDFTANGTDNNGNYQWINSANGLVMSYNVNSGQWEVTPWTNVGTGTMTLTQSPPQVQPIGIWTNNGGNPKFPWQVQTGLCTPFPLSLDVQLSQPLCEGENGSAFMSATQGTPPYSYKIDGVTPYQNSGVFSNLPSGTYTATVQDSSIPPNTDSVSFVIINGSPSTVYNLYLTKSNVVTVPNTVQNSVTVTYDYSAYVQPSLPPGATISFNLSFNHTEERKAPTNGTSVQFTTLITGIIDGSTITFSPSAPQTVPGEICQVTYVGDITTYVTTSTTIPFSENSVLTGTVSQVVDLNGLSQNCYCPTVGINQVTMVGNNLVLSGTNCGVLGNEKTNTLTESATRTGCISVPI